MGAKISVRDFLGTRGRTGRSSHQSDVSFDPFANFKSHIDLVPPVALAIEQEWVVRVPRILHQAIHVLGS